MNAYLTELLQDGIHVRRLTILSDEAKEYSYSGIISLSEHMDIDEEFLLVMTKKLMANYLTGKIGNVQYTAEVELSDEDGNTVPLASVASCEAMEDIIKSCINETHTGTVKTRTKENLFSTDGCNYYPIGEINENLIKMVERAAQL